MKNQKQVFDVIVVGGGHAGTEAALASARMGACTLLLTHNIDTLGQLSCNPSIGGMGKSQLVREVDALGGIMALAADCSGIHWSVLNANKGPAARATRAQVDRSLYKQTIRAALEQQANLKIFQQAVVDISIKANKVVGVITQLGITLYAESIVLTTGTFLNGKIHVGSNSYGSGRAGEPAAEALAERLSQFPLRMGRLKTGTPPRLDGRTLDYAVLEEKLSLTIDIVFSSQGHVNLHPEQRSCFMAHTNVQTHQLILDNLKYSPMYTGQVIGKGPRHCPSIEDKVVRFHQQLSHQIFLEPEGLNTAEVYPNGLSTSLPFSVQLPLIHSIKGLEKAHITRPGYAIEYDFFDPRDLLPSLQSRLIAGLFFAGQINGTTGYEEAAAQGLIAGLNAALWVRDQSNWCPGRREAYIGVLIDDLVTQGVAEPYRMLTSRSEYRLFLREDNADLRLTDIGCSLGLISEQHSQRYLQKKEALSKEKERLHQLWVSPDTELAKSISKWLPNPLSTKVNAAQLLMRPELRYSQLMALPEWGPGLQNSILQHQLESELRYSPYIKRQKKLVNQQIRYHKIKLSANLNYSAMHGLSLEACQQLEAHRPLTLWQAGRLPGVTPAALSVILVHLKKEAALSAEKVEL